MKQPAITKTGSKANRTNEERLRLTHGGGEDDDAEDVHLLAAAGTRLVHDLRRRSQLQVHRPTFGVALVGDDVDEVGLDGSGRDFEDRNQVRFVLKEEKHSRCVRTKV